MEPNVLVTGFGPFGEHKINASWEAVKLLPDEVENFKVIKKEIPVIYSYLDEIVPKLWEKYKPRLTIHVGVSSYANKITLETVANKNGYLRPDCSNVTHPTGYVTCLKSKAESLTTGIDVDTVCRVLNEDCKSQACISTNAGRYLCEYIYYLSLDQDKDRTLFIHVPPLNEPFSAEELCSAILNVIKIILNCNCHNDIENTV